MEFKNLYLKHRGNLPEDKDQPAREARTSLRYLAPSYFQYGSESDEITIRATCGHQWTVNGPIVFLPRAGNRYPCPECNQPALIGTRREDGSVTWGPPNGGTVYIDAKQRITKKLIDSKVNKPQSIQYPPGMRPAWVVSANWTYNRDL